MHGEPGHHWGLKGDSGDGDVRVRSYQNTSEVLILTVWLWIVEKCGICVPCSAVTPGPPLNVTYCHLCARDRQVQGE